MSGLVVIVSDLHGDAVTAGVRRRRDVRTALQEAERYAIEQKAAAFLFLGDLCNPRSPGSYGAIADFRESLYRLNEYDIERGAITGNHDVIEDGSGEHTLLPLGDLCEVLPVPGFFEVEGVGAIFGLPYTAASRAYVPAEEIGHLVDGRPPHLRAVVGHLELPGAYPGSEKRELARGRAVHWPIDEIRALHARGVRAFGGHHHRHQPATDECPVEIVGAPARFDHGEEDNTPGFLAVRFPDDGPAVSEHVPVAARRLYTIQPYDARWRGCPGEDVPAEGDIVRLLPPHDVTDAQLGAIERGFRDAGAAAVTAGPRAPAPSTAVEGDEVFDLDQDVGRDAPSAGDLRSEVDEVLASAKGISQALAPAVRSALDESLTEAGL